MSFLHGVLQSVKDDDNVTKYDNARDKNITNTIKKLNDSVGKGREAFPEAVHQVSSTLNVTIELGKYVTSVSSQAEKPLKEQLDNWTKTVNDINTHINDNIITNVDKLDPALSDKIKRNIEPVQKVVAHLGGVGRDPNFTGHPEFVDEQLRIQRENVERVVNVECEELQRKVQLDFAKIFEQSKRLSRKREEEFGYVRYAVKQARDAFIEDFEGKYKSEIERYFMKIEETMTAIDTQNTTGGNSQLHKLATKIKDALDALDGQLNKGANAIGGAIDFAVTEVNIALRDLDGKVMEDLRQLESGITVTLNPLVEKSVSFFATFKKTKNAIEVAIDAVSTDIKKFKDLTNLDTFKNSAAPLLNAIGLDGKNAFEKLIAYFNDISAKVMTPLKDVIGRLVRALESVAL
ncbi:hypothetical protein, conserved [Babesia ovata]|uniref:Uncharacterized protein n=1 Tax=Babesia ovata TaxID=189622 RepID=A0A2H6KIW7_9APIC|nr:uncharacterized protein BOVATA_044190 [Babesia ovata]GBE62926.1 hypothetical protein, conserved [Babesia ovata]